MLTYDLIFGFGLTLEHFTSMLAIQHDNQTLLFVRFQRACHVEGRIKIMFVSTFQVMFPEGKGNKLALTEWKLTLTKAWHGHSKGGT